MATPFFSPSAQKDLREILDYIARDKPTAARNFIDRIEQQCHTLAIRPAMGFVRDEAYPFVQRVKSDSDATSLAKVDAPTQHVE